MYHYIKNVYKKIVINSISGYKNIDGWLSENEAFGLYKYGKKVRNGNLVEIGSWKGKSTICIAKAVLLGRVYSIDPFNADGEVQSKKEYSKKINKGKTLLETFIHNLKANNILGKVSICKGYSSEWKNYFWKISFLFIDGDHSIKGCEYDFKMYSPKVVKKGYILFHDYYPDRIDLGPTYVVNKYIKNNKKYRIKESCDSLLIVQKLF